MNVADGKGKIVPLPPERKSLGLWVNYSGSAAPTKEKESWVNAEIQGLC